MAATLLNEQPVRLKNVPLLEDVRIMGEVLASLGAVCDGMGQTHEVGADCSRITSMEPPYELVNRMRASFLVLGPLVARFGRASVPLPGGCAIGARPVGEHLRALEALGAEVRQDAGRIVAEADKLMGADIYLNISSVGATENAVMAAALAEGTTTVHNAAEEPEVTDLCNFLTRCGVAVEGAGTKSVTVHGQSRISAAVDYTVIPDRAEAGTYLLAIVGTGGGGTVRCRPDHLESLLLKLREMGVVVRSGDDWVSVEAPAEMQAASLRTEVYPGFPTDLQPQASSVLTIARGTSTVEETIFEQRLSHVPELVRMGANLRISGEVVVVEGAPGCLTGVPVEAHDLRGAAALVVAGLIASGETSIDGLKHLVRGYEELPAKIAMLGGKVDYVEDE
jgi:UDP-N-acetylglucosamine 1-carboxyvinyltransferase